ncbi:MAG: lipoyl(octanoyl) transferase LipB [Deltaproteobacteria bacterium]|nr:lipoyl(octanoyl) transferase LipB [Deltaproteobacteria bacterium]
MFSTKLLNLPYLPYIEALELMRGLVDQKRRFPFPEVLILLEHEPVLTMGRRAGPTDILAPEAVLAEKGIQVHNVERGGLITYHGPGQLVAYPIFNLRSMGLSVPELVYGLEEIILQTLSDFGITAEREAGKRGVWVGKEKIASIGVAVRGGVSFHGLALNYDPDLAHFDLINPCGLSGVRMTSMRKILGRPINASDLRSVITGHFSRQFKLDLREWSHSKNGQTRSI